MKLTQERINEIEALAKHRRQIYFEVPTYNSYKTFIGYSANSSNKPGYRTHAESRALNRDLFNEVCKLFKSNGWKVTADPEILRNYRILSATHRLAVKGELQAKIEYYPAGMNVEFYPTYNPDHKAGPNFGYTKYERMTYLDKKRFELTRNKIAKLFASKGAIDRSELDFSIPREEVEYRVRESWHYTGYDIETGDPQLSEYNARDANKNPLQNGQRKFFFDWNGDIAVGTIYHNINNMWWVISGGRVNNIASFDFFDHDPVTCVRRYRNHRMIRRIQYRLEEAVKAQAFEKAIHLRDQLKLLVKEAA